MTDKETLYYIKQAKELRLLALANTEKLMLIIQMLP
jgi:hypothetical protein